MDWDKSNATAEEKERFITEVLLPYSHVFSLHEEEIDLAKDVAFRIETTPGEPIQQRPRRLSPGTLSAVQEEIRRLLLMQRIAQASGALCKFHT